MYQIMIKNDRGITKLIRCLTDFYGQNSTYRYDVNQAFFRPAYSSVEFKIEKGDDHSMILSSAYPLSWLPSFLQGHYQEIFVRSDGLDWHTPQQWEWPVAIYVEFDRDCMRRIAYFLGGEQDWIFVADSGIFKRPLDSGDVIYVQWRDDGRAKVWTRRGDRKILRRITREVI